MTSPLRKYAVRQATACDIDAIIGLCRAVYAESPPWTSAQLRSHQLVFPEGQLVVYELETDEIIGMASSLIVYWDDYDWDTPWRDFTAFGTFTNHDPTRGRTLYGAEVMVHPKAQGTGAGSLLYKAREDLARRLNLLRIRAGARLRGYHHFAQRLNAEDYVLSVVRGDIKDPTLSFQLKHGFQVLRVIGQYLLHDPESLGYAAVIEWINLEVALPADYDAALRSRFYRIAN